MITEAEWRRRHRADLDRVSGKTRERSADQMLAMLPRGNDPLVFDECSYFTDQMADDLVQLIVTRPSACGKSVKTNLVATMTQVRVYKPTAIGTTDAFLKPLLPKQDQQP